MLSFEHDGVAVIVDRTLFADDGAIEKVTRVKLYTRLFGTPLDFRQPVAVGARIDEKYPQLVNGGGYDHNWVLTEKAASGSEPAAKVRDPKTGRTLVIYTEEPGIQFYAGNFLDGSIVGKEGAVYNYRNTVVLETQHFPDSPNQPDFPSTRLDPGEVYKTRTVFEFGVEP